MMRFKYATVLAGCLVALATAASAAEVKPFSPGVFDAARAAGKPIVLDISAPWCSTCKAQKPLVDALLHDAKYNDLLVLDVDFDTQKAVLRKLNVREQSTFVAFKGKQEVGRSTGDTDQASIGKLFDKTS